MKRMKIKKDGKRIDITAIGFFAVPDLEKEYIMYSVMDDDSNNSNGAMLLGEVVRNGDNIEILGILKEEKDLVVAYYNEISTQLGGE